MFVRRPFALVLSGAAAGFALSLTLRNEPPLPTPARLGAPALCPPAALTPTPPAAAPAPAAPAPASSLTPAAPAPLAPAAAPAAPAPVARGTPGSLLSGFRVLGPGQHGGVRLGRVGAGTLPSALGLQSFDEVLSINGYELRDPEQALLAYARLRSAERLSLKLNRRGSATEIVYYVR